ncbi:MAG: efflux RND transporter periplasmic adaptor subunit, partial [Chitinophagales bacterium]|nr:efflux RND transporter periplasmic adaptor subunit [Chitinophagales bacterium]
MRKYFYNFLLTISTASIVACGGKKDGQQAGAAAMQAQETPVQVIQIPKGDFSSFNTYPTSLEGINNTDARPKITGYITDVLVDEGQRVSKGQLLFKLETQSLSEDAAAAKANISAAQAAVNAAQVEVDKLIPLVEKNIISDAQLQTANANLARANSQLKQAQAAYQSVLANIGYANVTSPVNGYVGAIRIRKGNLVGPADPRPLTTISDISKVYAYFSLNEKEYLDFLETAEGNTREQKIKNLPPVTLILANGSEYAHKGTIQTINSQINPQTGSISYRAIFDNPEQLLTNGGTGQILIPRSFKDVLLVPQKSTFERQGRVYVLKVDEVDGKKQAVETIIDVKDQKQGIYMVSGGINEGDEIVAEGVSRLRSGTPVIPTLVPYDSIATPSPAV